MKSHIIYLILTIIFSLLSVSFSLGEDKSNQIKEYTATIDQDGVQRVEIVGGGYYFDPNYITVKANVPVELTVTKEPGIVPHNIVMKSPETGIEFAKNLSIDPQIITFTPTKPGKYPIYCNKKLLFFENHSEKGMKGTLEVLE
ncbi:MAG: cupredoxin domain-containing protein [Flavobacteriaceae bacterium]|nr:MAG: cupredoxin domain-containing protein [Flavobacteriaceae bacterium]